jgi:hypothetical protein
MQTGVADYETPSDSRPKSGIGRGAGVQDTPRTRARAVLLSISIIQTEDRHYVATDGTDT